MSLNRLPFLGAIAACLLAPLLASSGHAQSTLAEGAAARYPTPLTGEAPFDFYGRGPYRDGVPRPDDLLGYRLGTWHSTFRDQERVLLAIAEAARDRVRVWEYGRSVEGRPLRLFAISTPENIAALDTIREKNLRLADPGSLSDTDAQAIVQTSPALVWINECIHGSETASFETAMATFYTLVASDAPELRDTLKNTVVLLNPVFNPDGHERYVVYMNAAAAGSAEPFAFERSVPWLAEGRFNHNRFDMNRDKVAQSQPETRQETREFLRWLPQVFVDQHGQPETYFFPPNAQATNNEVDRARLEKWTSIFGRANGADFDTHGWAYVNRETFDFFYPGYLDSFTTLCGAIGMTYETDGGGTLVRRRGDGTLSTLRDATAHHFETAITTIETAAKQRETLLRDFLAYKRSAIAPGKPGTTGRVVILPGRDPRRAAELASLLLRLGIRVSETTAPLTATAARAYDAGPAARGEKRIFPAGALVIDLAQPQGHLVRTLLQSDNAMEPEFVKAQLARRERNEARNENEPSEEYAFYDTTAWSLPYTYDLEAFATADTAALPNAKPLALAADGLSVTLSGRTVGGLDGKTAAPVAYAIPFMTDGAPVLGLRLLQEGFRVATATEPVTIGGKAYRAGTLFVRPARNRPGVNDRLDTLGKALGVPVETLSSAYGGDTPDAGGLGSQAIGALKTPRIAVVGGDGVSQTSYGSVTFTLKEMGVRFTTIPIRALKNASARAAFNAILLPDGSGYKDGLGKDAIAALKEWASGGGCLIGLQGGAAWMTDKDADLTSVRPVGASDDDEKKKDDAKSPPPTRPVYLPGALFRAKIRPDHFLGYGYPEGTIPVPLAEDTFWKTSTTGANVVTFTDSGTARLSGFVWPDNTEKLLKNTAYVVDEPTGRGHVLLFLQDPTERYMYLGLRRLFLSALLYGPARDADDGDRR